MILCGGDDSDIIVSRKHQYFVKYNMLGTEQSCNNMPKNKLVGGAGHDTIITLNQSDIIKAGDGQDFCMSITVDPQRNKLSSVQTGPGNDIIVLSYVSWHLKNEEIGQQLYKASIEAGPGDDIIIPFMDRKNIQQSLSRTVFNQPFQNFFYQSNYPHFEYVQKYRADLSHDIEHMFKTCYG